MRHNPCVIDVFISATRVVSSEESRPWWNYAEERKKSHAKTDTGKMKHPDIYLLVFSGASSISSDLSSSTGWPEVFSNLALTYFKAN